MENGLNFFAGQSGITHALSRAIERLAQYAFSFEGTRRLSKLTNQNVSPRRRLSFRSLPSVSSVQSNQGLVINEFRGHADAIFPIPPGIPLDPDEVCQIFLDAYGFGDGGRLMNIKTEIVLILLLNYVVFRLMTLICAKYIVFERR